MARQNIFLGTVANDGTGDTLRTAGEKINNTLAELYNFLGGDSDLLPAIPGGSSTVSTADEGSFVALASTLNFTGAGVSVSDAGAGQVNVTVSGVAGQIVEAPRTVPTKAGFSIDLNGASAAAVDGSYGLILNSAVDASLMRALMNTAGGADFTVTAKVRVATIPNFTGSGIVLRDTAGKYILFGPMGANSAGYIEYSQWSDQTTFASGVGGTGLGTTDLWIRIFYNHGAGTIQGFTSLTGEGWLALPTTNNYLSSNIDAVGIGIAHRQTTFPHTAIFTHYAVT